MNVAACAASGVPGCAATTCSNSSSALAASPLLKWTLAMPSVGPGVAGRGGEHLLELRLGLGGLALGEVDRAERRGGFGRQRILGQVRRDAPGPSRAPPPPCRRPACPRRRCRAGTGCAASLGASAAAFSRLATASAGRFRLEVGQRQVDVERRHRRRLRDRRLELRAAPREVLGVEGGDAFLELLRARRRGLRQLKSKMLSVPPADLDRVADRLVALVLDLQLVSAHLQAAAVEAAVLVGGDRHLAPAADVDAGGWSRLASGLPASSTTRPLMTPSSIWATGGDGAAQQRRPPALAIRECSHRPCLSEAQPHAELHLARELRRRRRP